MGRSGSRKSTKRKQTERRRSQPRARREEMARRIQELAEAKLEAILDPELPAEESAAELLDLFAPELPEIGISVVIASRSTPERAREVAELDEDLERAEELLHAAMERSDDPELGWRHAAVRLSAGRVADVLGELDATCAAAPLDDDAQALRAKALEEAVGRARGDPGRPCPCGSGRPHRRCCRKRERRALDRFEDRGPFDDLRRSLAAFSSHARFDPIREATSEDWRAVDLEALGPGVDRLAEEWSWLVVPADPERPEGPENTLLAPFAAEPSTPPEQAARAREWLDSARYGLWQVADPTPRPGVWLTDILSGVDRYVAMPPEQVEGLARWTVLLGCLVPVDGVRRAGGAFLPLTPTLGDVLAERVHEVAAVLSWLVAASLPELVSWVQERTGRWPALTNTDGDPLPVPHRSHRGVGPRRCAPAPQIARRLPRPGRPGGLVRPRAHGHGTGDEPGRGPGVRPAAGDGARGGGRRAAVDPWLPPVRGRSPGGGGELPGAPRAVARAPSGHGDATQDRL